MGHLTQVEHPPLADALAEVAEGVVNLIPDLVTARSDAGPDRGGAGPHLVHTPSDDPGCQPAPAAVKHRHTPLAGQRDGEAVGDEDERREPGPVGCVAVGLG